MAIDFVDLHSHSAFSILDGHPDPEGIATKAVQLGRRAHAITDHGSISGHVAYERAVRGMKQVGFRGYHSKFKETGEDLALIPIYGLEAYTVHDVKVRDESTRVKNHLTVLAKNAAGYQNMLSLVTRSWDEGFYYRQTIDGQMLADGPEGLIVLSGCENSSFMRAVAQGEYERARKIAQGLRSVFGDDFYIEVQHFPHVSAKNELAWQIAEEQGIKTVLTCDSHYLEPDGWRYQQFLWSVRDRRPVDDFKIEHAYLWEPDKLFEFCTIQQPTINWTRVFENTCEVAEKVEPFRLPRAKHVVYPMEGDKIEYIRAVCAHRLAELGLWERTEYRDRLDRELDAIAFKKYEDYFLVVADMVRWAKSQGIYVGPARGSAAGSLVCWALRITEIDPIRFGLLFERFVDPTRTDLPDIDVDFEDDRRREVFAYMRDKYGAENVAGVGTFARFQSKNTLDDAAKSYRIPLSDIDVVKRHLVERSSGDQRAELTIQDTLEEFPEAREVFDRYPQLMIAAGCQGGYRSVGRHAAGIVVTPEPIARVAATYKQAEEKDADRILTIDWRDAAYLNLMKIDALGLKELGILRIICEQVGLTLADLYDIPFDDPKVFDGFNRGDFLGIFQFGGLATKGVANRIHFTSIEQIADVNALSRPGPLHAGATELYIKGAKEGSFTPILPQAAVKPILDQTYGQIIYQEQVMRILRDVGGMTWDDVCDIRQIMGKSKGSDAFNNYWPSWAAGVAETGLSEADAKQIWETIRLFGKHSFNKSHSVAYGIIAYWSMWMKVHHPKEFYIGYLRKEPDENVGRFLSEAMRRGIEFAPFSLSCTSETWYLDDQGRIAPGYGALKGIGEKVAPELVKHAPFADIEEVKARCVKRLVNSKVQKILEENIGADVVRLFNLDRWIGLDIWAKDRSPINDFNGFPGGTKALVAGKVIRINKKNRIEEHKTKGKDISKLDPGANHDYVILIVEDETDSCMIYVGPDLYAENHKHIWGSKDNYVAATGSRAPGVQLLSAKTLSFASTRSIIDLLPQDIRPTISTAEVPI